ncbi:hypothetical protein GCM10020221_07810 [Streptomyces thioluteus]|uniref:Uncharacterized protein n=1 Tax=Streptomyces thioluteus TaxID=66431 RepID=A0ABN3WFV9_STRTU
MVAKAPGRRNVEVIGEAARACSAAQWPRAMGSAAGSGTSTEDDDSSTMCRTPGGGGRGEEVVDAGGVRVEEDGGDAVERGGERLRVVERAADAGYVRREVRRFLRGPGGGADRQAAGVQELDQGAADAAAGAGDEGRHGGGRAFRRMRGATEECVAEILCRAKIAPRK